MSLSKVATAIANINKRLAELEARAAEVGRVPCPMRDSLCDVEPGDPGYVGPNLEDGGSEQLPAGPAGRPNPFDVIADREDSDEPQA